MTVAVTVGSRDVVRVARLAVAMADQTAAKSVSYWADCWVDSMVVVWVGM